MNNLKISIIIPMKNEEFYLPTFLNKLILLDQKPDEIIFIDGGSIDQSTKIVESFYEQFKSFNVNIKLIKVKQAFPGKARNIGIRNAANDWIVLLDVGLYPKEYWLKQLWNEMHKNNSLVVFAKCRFISNTFVGRIMCAISYGVNSNLNVLPASLIHKSLFEENGFFVENLRGGEDIIWVNNLKRSKLILTGKVLNSSIETVEYTDFNTKFNEIIEKYFLYAFCKESFQNLPIIKKIVYIYLSLSIYFLIIDIKISFLLFVFYFIARGFLIPLFRSSKKKWWNFWSQFLLAPFYCLLIDFISFVGFSYAKFNRLICFIKLRYLK